MHLTQHARQRAMQRVGHAPDLRCMVPLPRSAVRAFPCPPGIALRRGIRLYVTARHLLVVRGCCVVTCLRLEPENLAELLVRIMFSRGGRS